MALKGTIQDFGVADIFQLISQQVKTGRLVLSNDVDQVQVMFSGGAVIHAENASTPSQRLFGNMLVRAEIVTQSQLEQALEIQRQSLKRVGVALIDMGVINDEIVREFAQLQMTETIYSLFEWHEGTYEFESGSVDPSPDGLEPIRAETLVMNGIRMTDEWPSIREQIPSYTWQVDRMRDLPPPTESKPSSGVDEFDLSDIGEGIFDGIGTTEREIFDLIQPGRNVQKIIDLSRLGEFEACRALTELMGEGYIRIIKPSSGDFDVDGQAVSPLRKVFNSSARIVLSAALVVGISSIIAMGWAERKAPQQLALSTQVIEEHLAIPHLEVLMRALEVYRLNHGEYPERLQQLVDAGILKNQDLVYPFGKPYFYSVKEGKVTLLSPVR